MRRWALQSTYGVLIVILFALSVALTIAYHRSKSLEIIDAELSVLFFLAAMVLVAVVIFQWTNAKLYYLWLALAAVGFAFAFSDRLVIENFFGPYPNLIESLERRAE